MHILHRVILLTFRRVCWRLLAFTQSANARGGCIGGFAALATSAADGVPLRSSPRQLARCAVGHRDPPAVLIRCAHLR